MFQLVNDVRPLKPPAITGRRPLQDVVDLGNGKPRECVEAKLFTRFGSGIHERLVASEFGLPIDTRLEAKTAVAQEITELDRNHVVPVVDVEVVRECLVDGS